MGLTAGASQLDLSRLNTQQREAVLAGDGPLLILAGPGSGKTTVLAARIAYLVAGRSVSPSSILALSFATKAARELRDRLSAILGDAGHAIDVATFHAFGLRVIRQWSEELGLGPRSPVVYDGRDSRSILADLVRPSEHFSGGWSLVELARLVERYRLGDDVVRGESSEEIASLAEAYEGVLRRRGAVDYPAMLALPLRLFEQRPDALRFLQDVYRHVLVDEFQDLCASQYRLVRDLALRHRNLVVVGDPAQTVFTWRGADVRFVRAFLDDFPEARVIGLEHNFRSTGRIVDLANALGRPLAYYRPLTTDNPPGEPSLLVVNTDERAEAQFIAAEIARLGSAGQIDHPGQVAVLYRTNQQAAELAQALRERRVPYLLRGDVDLLARREVRDAIAYLRLACKPEDRAALTRIVNVPPRGLGRIAERLRTDPGAPANLIELAKSAGPRAVDHALDLVAVLDEIHRRSFDLRPTALLDFVLERSGYRDWLAGQPEGTDRLAHLGTLREIAERSTDLADLLGILSADEDAADRTDDHGRVVLTTIHGAKGGEWRIVFVAGLEEGLLPHQHALIDRPHDPTAIEAELRVAYVAVTRPRERLYVTYARTRRRGSGSVPRQPSRFLRGLPLEVVDRAA